MRRLAFVLALAAAGCGRPPAAQQEAHFKDLLLLHFNNLNNDAELARMDAKVARGPMELSPSSGRQFSTYTWHPDGFILNNVECPRCGTRHKIVMYRGQAVLCSSCGSRNKDGGADALIRGGQSRADLEQTYKDRVQLMFDPQQDRNKDKVAIVRYVRRHWTLDPRAKVEISADAAQKYNIADITTPKGDSNYYGGNYHRLDGTYVATTAFVYDGTISQVDRRTVEKMVKGETPEPKAWKLGPDTAVEDAVRPWTQPRTLDTPNVRAK